MSANNILLSCYFTSRPDPQCSVVHKPEPEKMKLWYESAISVGINSMVIFQDGFPQIFGKLFPAAYMPFANLPDYEISTRPMSINDIRFLIFLTYLVENPQIEQVLITDLFDVEFYKNPFESLLPGILYIGSNDKWIDKPKQWDLLRTLTRTDDISRYFDLPLLNPGIIGGGRDIVIDFIRDMLPMLGEQFNNNMPLANIVGYSDKWRDRIITGAPLHTRFKGYDGRDSGAYIRHK